MTSPLSEPLTSVAPRPLLSSPFYSLSEEGSGRRRKVANTAEPGWAQHPSHVLPTLALASSFYPSLHPPPSGLYLSLLLNKLNLVSVLFSCPPESTSFLFPHKSTAETLALTDTPIL